MIITGASWTRFWINLAALPIGFLHLLISVLIDDSPIKVGHHFEIDCYIGPIIEERNVTHVSETFVQAVHVVEVRALGRLVVPMPSSLIHRRLQSAP